MTVANATALGTTTDFPPTFDAALSRLDAVRPAEYARTRNALNGAVTGLSPYFTHGLITLPLAMRRLLQRHALTYSDKLVFEFAWRSFFHHVWRHAGQGGEAILADLRPNATWSGTYAAELPADIREGRTGVGAVDAAVRTLYATGYLHNHARMWLASYVVHLRKVHWRAGADWLYAHLLDGDLASNHLSWQWVASTFSSKPYLFNAENVARYAPRLARPATGGVAWDSTGTAIDTSYEALDAIARSRRQVGTEPGHHSGVAEPALHASPPGDLLAALGGADGPVNDGPAAAWRDRPLELVQPWDLAEPGPQAPGEPARYRLGVVHVPAHERFPWSERRWRFVLARLVAVCDGVHVGDLTTLDTTAARSVHATATRQPGYREGLHRPDATLREVDDFFPDPGRPCESFSRYYAQVQRQSGSLQSLLNERLW